MPTITNIIHIELFENLTDEQKERVIDRYRSWYTEDFNFFTECIMSDFIEDMEAQGMDVDEKRIWFSGFWSQGDGACFSGAITDIDKWLAFNGEAFSKKERRIIKDALENSGGEASTKGNARYGYNQQTNVTWNNPHENHVDGEYVNGVLTNVTGRQAEAFNLYEKVMNEFTYAFEQFCQDKAHEYYKSLEKEYEYLSSDEYLSEMFTEEGYYFSIETGEMYDAQDVDMSGEGEPS